MYGPIPMVKKKTFMNLQNHVKIVRHDYWIIGEKFTMIRSLQEKRGGIILLDEDLHHFTNFLQSSKLVDQETINGIFTWNNKRGGCSQVASRLDIFLIFEPLFLLGINFEASIFLCHGSNH